MILSLLNDKGLYCAIRRGYAPLGSSLAGTQNSEEGSPWRLAAEPAGCSAVDRIRGRCRSPIGLILGVSGPSLPAPSDKSATKCCDILLDVRRCRSPRDLILGVSGPSLPASPDESAAKCCGILQSALDNTSFLGFSGRRTSWRQQRCFWRVRYMSRAPLRSATKACARR